MSYTDNQIKSIINSFNNCYSKSDLKKLHTEFSWNGKNADPAWAIRKELSFEMSTAVKNNFKNLKEIAEKIHKWGFNRQIRTELAKEPKFWTALQETLIEFNKKSENFDRKKESLEKLLTFRYLGIATASKWICFLDQTRYAIYDSRVSVALRNVRVDESFRAFPIVARRGVEGGLAWQADGAATNGFEISKAYVNYIKVLGIISAEIKFQPSEIEMALFMAGSLWANNQPKLMPLYRGQAVRI